MAALAGAGCGDDAGAGADPAATSATTAAPSTTTTTEATTTTTAAPPATIEPPANTGTDMAAVLQSLSDFGNRLGMAPDPALVDLAYEPGTSPHEGFRRIQQELVDRRWRWNGPTEELREIRDTGAIDARSWSLTAISAPVEGSLLLGPDGEAIPDQPPPLAPQRYVIQLVLGADGRWRIGDLEPLGGPLE